MPEADDDDLTGILTAILSAARSVPLSRDHADTD
jgi:hypothetical protein